MENVRIVSIRNVRQDRGRVVDPGFGERIGGDAVLRLHGGPRVRGRRLDDGDHGHRQYDGDAQRKHEREAGLIVSKSSQEVHLSA